MTAQLEDALSIIFDAVQIHSPNAFAFAGGPRIEARREPSIERPLYRLLPEDPLIRELQYTLYFHCYTRRFDGSASAANVRQISEPDAGFVERLVNANRGKYRWDAGWKIYRLCAEGQIQVYKGDRFRTPLAGEYAYAGGPGVTPQVDEMVSVQVLAESQQLQPAFYFVFGETLSDYLDEFNRVRFYFHCDPEAAPLLVEQFSTTLNRYQVPFQFKCNKDPINYDRLDSCVLYVAKRYFTFAAGVVASLPDEVYSLLKLGTPLFSKRFRPGIGIADDPGYDQSFGMHRCQLLAEGIVDAWSQGSQSTADRLQAVKERFASAGLDFERPYLNPHSADLFAAEMADECLA